MADTYIPSAATIIWEVDPRFQPKVTADEAGAEASLHKSIREDVPQLICGVGGDFQSLRYMLESRKHVYLKHCTTILILPDSFVVYQERDRRESE